MKGRFHYSLKAGLVIAVADGTVAARPPHVGPGGGAGDGRLVPEWGVTLQQEIIQIENDYDIFLFFQQL